MYALLAMPTTDKQHRGFTKAVYTNQSKTNTPTYNEQLLLGLFQRQHLRS